MARRTKYASERVAKICEAISLGATYDLASKYGGISFETFNEWRKAKPEFAEAIADAEGKATVKWLAKIEKAASEGQWQAAAWKLERRYPHLYGRTVQEHTGGQEIQITIARQSDDTRVVDAGGEQRRLSDGTGGSASANLDG